MMMSYLEKTKVHIGVKHFVFFTRELLNLKISAYAEYRYRLLVYIRTSLNLQYLLL